MVKPRLPTVKFEAWSEETLELDVKLQHSGMTTTEALRLMPYVKAAIRTLELYHEFLKPLGALAIESMVRDELEQARMARSEAMERGVA